MAKIPAAAELTDEYDHRCRELNVFEFEIGDSTAHRGHLVDCRRQREEGAERIGHFAAQALREQLGLEPLPDLPPRFLSYEGH